MFRQFKKGKRRQNCERLKQGRAYAGVTTTTKTTTNKRHRNEEVKVGNKKSA